MTWSNSKPRPVPLSLLPSVQNVPSTVKNCIPRKIYASGGGLLAAPISAPLRDNIAYCTVIQNVPFNSDASAHRLSKACIQYASKLSWVELIALLKRSRICRMWLLLSWLISESVVVTWLTWVFINMVKKIYKNKCIGDDTKAAARQSLNCILLNK